MVHPWEGYVCTENSACSAALGGNFCVCLLRPCDVMCHLRPVLPWWLCLHDLPIGVSAVHLFFLLGVLLYIICSSLVGCTHINKCYAFSMGCSLYHYGMLLCLWYLCCLEMYVAGHKDGSACFSSGPVSWSVVSTSSLRPYVCLRGWDESPEGSTQLGLVFNPSNCSVPVGWWVQPIYV